MFLLETAEGALNQVTNIVIRMRELGTQAASDTNGEKERSYLDHEYQQLKQELERISRTTLYNGRPLLTGEGGTIDIQVGPQNDDFADRIRVNVDHPITLDSLDLRGLEIGTAEGARTSLETVSAALDKIAFVRGAIGASESRLNSTVANLMEYNINTSSAYSRIHDADIASETSELAKNHILTQAGVAVLDQANNIPSLALKLIGG